MSRNVMIGLAFLFVCATRAEAGEAPAGDTQTATSRRELRLHDELQDLLRTTGVPSVSIARISGGKIVSRLAAGRLNQHSEATPDAAYNVASLTKPVTAEVVLDLIAAGEFSLDHSLSSDWVDPDVANDPRHELLTPRLALSHRTGFPNWRPADGKLTFERAPGTAPGYSGEGYEYLVRFVQARTGERLDRLAQRLLFVPLGMATTSYTGEIPDAVRAGYRDSDGAWQSSSVRPVPLGSDDLWTTAGDYAHFMLSVMEGGRLGGELRTERERIQADRRDETCGKLEPSVCPDQAGFALGWELFVLGGKRYYMHTGSDDDSFGLAYWSPDNRSGAVVLTNASDGHRVILPVLDALGDNQEFVDLLRAMSK